MSLLFCLFLYVPLQLHTLPQHDALETQPVDKCFADSGCFCHESALNLIAASWQLELILTSAMDEDCDWH